MSAKTATIESSDLPLKPACLGNQAGADRSCDLCGERNFELVSQLDRHGRRLETAICTHCGLVGHLHLPTDEQLAGFYNQQYRLEYNGECTPTLAA